MFRAHTPETCRTKETSINCIVASRWRFILFHAFFLLSQRDEADNYITSVRNLDNSEECEWERSVCCSKGYTPLEFRIHQSRHFSLKIFNLTSWCGATKIPEGRMWGRLAVIYRDKRLLTYINRSISAILSYWQWR